jgi:sulfur carrier protein ThiS
MCMHHGSSKDARAAAAPVHRLRVPSGTLVRDALARVGILAEGCAVLDGDAPIPLDLPLITDRTLTIVPTFSGG